MRANPRYCYFSCSVVAVARCPTLLLYLKPTLLLGFFLVVYATTADALAMVESDNLEVIDAFGLDQWWDPAAPVYAHCVDTTREIEMGFNTTLGKLMALRML